MSQDPKISVLIPVFNGGAYLRQAIESVLVQTERDFELLVHDDGSTDGSLAILRDYEKKDARVHVTTAPNAGLIATLNSLAARARSDILARMDADDVCMPDRFSRQLRYLSGHPDCVLLGTQTQSMDAAGRVIAPNLLRTSHAEIDEWNLRGNTALVHPTVMIRKQAFDAVGGYSADYPASEDQELWLRLAEIGQIANLPEVLLNYRIHGDSVSARENTLQAASCKKACEDAARRRGLEPVFAFAEWRMTDDRASKRDFSIKYAWDAWNWGNLGTWRHYAMKAVAHDPLSLKAWKTLIMGGLHISKSGRAAREFADRQKHRSPVTEP